MQKFWRWGRFGKSDGGGGVCRWTRSKQEIVIDWNFVFFCILSFCSDKKKQIKIWSKKDRRILFVSQNIKSDLSLICSNKTLFLFSLSQTAVIAEIGDGGVFNYQRGFYCCLPSHSSEFCQNGRKAVNSQNFSDGENNVSNIFLTKSKRLFLFTTNCIDYLKLQNGLVLEDIAHRMFKN